MKHHYPALSFAASLLLISLTPAVSFAATVQWGGGSGDWGDATKWSSGTVPGKNDDVVIADPNGDVNVTISSGAISVNSLVSDGTMQLSGGTLQLANTFRASGAERPCYNLIFYK